jgi:hypothetical protein
MDEKEEKRGIFCWWGYDVWVGGRRSGLQLSKLYNIVIIPVLNISTTDLSTYTYSIDSIQSSVLQLQLFQLLAV